MELGIAFYFYVHVNFFYRISKVVAFTYCTQSHTKFENCLDYKNMPQNITQALHYLYLECSQKGATQSDRKSLGRKTFDKANLEQARKG